MTPATPPNAASETAAIGEMQLRAMAAVIRAEIPEAEVRLFGSRARGEARPDSDVDLLVVMPHQGPAATQAARIRQQLRAPFALDLIVRSPEVLRRRIKLGDSFLRGVMSEGKVLYESAR